PAAEASRITRLIGDQDRPYLASASTLVGIAESLVQPKLTPDALRRQVGIFDTVVRALAGSSAQTDGRGESYLAGRLHETAATFRRAVDRTDDTSVSGLASIVRLLADDVLAEGLQELVYAAALGQPDRVSVSAGELAERHDFAFSTFMTRRPGPWQPPEQ